MYTGLRRLISHNPSYSLSLNTKAMSSWKKKFQIPAKYKSSKETIWTEFNALAMKYKALNLGQGFADFPPPSHVTQALADVSKDENPLLQQYSRGFGHIRLVNALSKVYSKMIGCDIDPISEILTTAGAYESVYCAIFGFVNDGDEVILIEPFFDCYEPMVLAANGKPVFVPLRLEKPCGDTVLASDWKLDEEELNCAFSDKTKLIILNNPHNPMGKVFSMEELTIIADLCKKWNVLCISDEVYEWMVYKPCKHIRIATLPDMWERTVSIGSAGKTFSVTGWKTGWSYGPENLINNMKVVHQNVLNSINTPISEAIARSFELELARIDSPECYLVSLAEKLKEKCDFMVELLTDIGMVPTIPQAGYFMIADWTPLADKADLSEETDEHEDVKFTKWLAKNHKLLGIPPSAFYGSDHKDLAKDYIRFCFVKKDENLQKAGEILKKWACGSSKM